MSYAHGREQLPISSAFIEVRPVRTQPARCFRAWVGLDEGMERPRGERVYAAAPVSPRHPPSRSRVREALASACWGFSFGRPVGGPPGRWHVSRPTWRSARLAPCVGLERGSVSPRKVSSGGPCPCHNTRSRISSRSLAFHTSPCPCGAGLPQANFLGATEPRAARPRNEGRATVHVARRPSRWVALPWKRAARPWR
jgi:hypothetical protein